MPHRKHFSFHLFVLLLVFSGTAMAQPTWTFDPFGKEKKPEKYEEKKLASEKTADKKFTTFRRFLQNTTTHYNYFFNAQNKIDAVLERAKASNADDYGKLLAFYPYTLENTSSQKAELDSVIYKATAGILLHDLRSDWVDNMYLLIGKSYYFRKEFDSAALTFQFINYNLFPRKKKEDDNRIVGTNQAAKSSILSIADKEKRNILDKAISRPPSRNEALIWLARTFVDKEEFGDAAGMINILRNDPNLPKRLINDLEEVEAYLFYMQGNYDSSAVHLEKALSTAVSKQDKSRWEFLLGQMYEMGGNFEKASGYYAKSSKHTVDPVMDINARLNSAKMYKDNGNTRELDNSIARLLKMAKRDRYESYRDIIYYSAAKMSLQKPDTTVAKKLLAKSVKYNSTNQAYRNKAYLQLGNLAYDERQYKLASSYYDSLQLDDPSIKEDAALINARKNTLTNIVALVNIIEREDSLQRIASMPQAEREAFIRKLLKKYRKETGQKEEESTTGAMLTGFSTKGNEPVDLFAAPSKGEWYFYNSSMKSKGFSEFKSKWGKRENKDNWRRKSAGSAPAALNLTGNIDIDAPPDSSLGLAGTKPGETKPVEYTFIGLMEDLPLTQERIDSSNSNIARSMLSLAKLFQQELEDYQEAVNTYEEYLQRFPNRLENGDVYLGLYFCYNKLGNTAKADYYKNLLTKNFSGSNAEKLLTNPAALKPDEKNPDVTRRYEAIYDMFIEGRFAEASDAKKKADSIHGNNYWTPQLLYIEAVGHIRLRNDSAAIVVLNNIMSMYPTSPLKEKAANMIQVLKRRAEIETYLSNLEVTRQEEDKVLIAENNQVVVQKAAPVVKPEIKTIAPVNKPQMQSDSIRSLPGMVSGSFRWESDKPHYVIMVLTKVDGVYVNEAKNAFARYNREKHANKPVTINKDALDGDRAMLVFEPFPSPEDAIAYYDKIVKAAPSEVSWLQPGKYSFMVISGNNLQLLKTNKDMNAYRTLLSNVYPGKF